MYPYMAGQFGARRRGDDRKLCACPQGGEGPLLVTRLMIWLFNLLQLLTKNLSEEPAEVLGAPVAVLPQAPITGNCLEHDKFPKLLLKLPVHGASLPGFCAARLCMDIACSDIS